MIKLNNIFYFGLLLCIFLFTSPSLGLKIKYIDVPAYHVITENPPQPLILKCDYELHNLNSNTSSVLKWKRNSQLVYQWMINKNQKPFAFQRSPLKDAIDINYEASDDVYKKYSSLAINNPTFNMSGNFECSVTEGADFAAVNANLSIIDVSNHTLEITKYETDEDIGVKCKAKYVYPKPHLKLRLNETETLYISKTEYFVDKDGYYDARIEGIIKNDGSIDDLTCVMSFPDTDYERIQGSKIEGNNSNRITSVTLLLPAMILWILMFNKYKF